MMTGGSIGAGGRMNAHSSYSGGNNGAAGSSQNAMKQSMNKSIQLNTNFYNKIYTSGELSLVSWLCQVCGEAGSRDLARPSWLCEFLKKENAKKKCAPLRRNAQKNENGFWAAPALVSLTWRGELEISMLPKHQFLQ